MNLVGKENTIFTIDQGLYCYQIMLFDLNSAKATCQSLVNKMFKDQIGQSMEVYVNDILVKIKAPVQHLEDLRESLQYFVKTR